MILIDGDKIEESNLNRQFLFTESYIDRFKAEVLKEELQKRNRNLHIECVKEYVGKGVIQKALSENENNTNNIIGILSADSPDGVEWAVKEFSKLRIPFLNIGYLNDIAVIGPFCIPSVSSCPFCYDSLSITATQKEQTISDKIIHDIEKTNSAPSNFINNAFSSSMAMSDIIQFLSHNLEDVKTINARIGMGTKNLESYQIKTSINPKCSFCGGNKSCTNS